MKMTSKRAFSLVELMISLIVISLITAALAPVITKKLSTGTITVGSFGGGGGSSSYTGEPRSQEDCDKISKTLMFISSTDSGNPKNLCVTRYNIGDHADLQIPSNAVPAGNIFRITDTALGEEKCKTDDITPCCWIGATSTNCNSANGSYSGCNRTVCNWKAADNICRLLNVNNQTGFRIPTESELYNLDPYKYVAHLKDDGLMFCEHTPSDGITLCKDVRLCNGTYDGLCNFNEIWHTTGNCILVEGIWKNYTNAPKTYGFSTRCVIDNITIQENSGGGGSSVNINSLKKTMCDMFDTKYWDEGEKSCKTCSDDIPNCEKCSNNTTCEKCKDSYELIDGACEYEPCSTANGLLKIKANLDGTGEKTYCITQYNIGDNENYRLPPAKSASYLYGVYQAGYGDDACKANYTTGCCWQGNTADGLCDSANGSYSGCSRTVCNWYAANGLCENLTIQGASGWRLPTQTELGNLNPATYSKIGTSYAGDNGLMFCDHKASYNSARCSHAEVCPGSYNGYCYPHDVWSGTLDDSTHTFYKDLRSGSWDSHSDSHTHPFSVRCIKEL